MSDLKKNIRNKKDRIITMLTVVTGVFLIGTIIFSLIYFQKKMNDTEKMLTKEENKQYGEYYVMIAPDMEADFKESVYNSALEEAKSNNIFLQLLEEDLDEDYSKTELLKIAINTNVDGIIVEGDESSETSELILKATQRGIPVVTVLDDSVNSGRKSFIGISKYNLGRAYASGLCDYVRKNKMEQCNALVLLDNDQSISNQSTLASAINEKIDEEELSDIINIDSLLINNDSDFEAEEEIRDLFVGNERLPDVIVCLNETNTICVMQTVIDYNYVGRVGIIGNYISDSISDAIVRGVIDSTLVIDSDQMGKQSVEALHEYNESGYVSEIYVIDEDIINSINIDSVAGGGSAHE